jgi:hypothetical protein
MKKSSETIGSRTRDLPVCSAVPHPLRHRVSPCYILGPAKYLVLLNVLILLIKSYCCRERGRNISLQAEYVQPVLC